MFTTITAQDTLFTLASSFVAREQEVHMYQINIKNFNAMLSALPQDVVPDKFAPYLKSEIKDLPVTFTDEDVQLLVDYAFREDLIVRIRTEKAEQSKAKRVLDVLKAQIPTDQFDALIAQVISSV